MDIFRIFVDVIYVFIGLASIVVVIDVTTGWTKKGNIEKC